MTDPKPTPPTSVIVRGLGGRHHVGQLARHDVYAARPWIELTAVRRLLAWPGSLGLDGLAVAAGDGVPLTGLKLGPAVPRLWVRDVEAVWWTSASAAAALHAHPVSEHKDPAPPLVEADGSNAPLASAAASKAPNTFTTATGVTLQVTPADLPVARAPHLAALRQVQP